MSAARRIAHCFDLSNSSGLGHYARARAMTRAFSEATGGASFTLVPLGRLPSFAASLLREGSFDQRASTELPLGQLLKEYDGAVLDSYDVSLQSLEWLGLLLTEKPEFRLGIICDTVWNGFKNNLASKAKNKFLLFDSTFCLDLKNIDPSVTVYRGVDAVFLNSDRCLSLGTDKKELLPPCIVLGTSSSAQGVSIGIREKWPESIEVRFSGTYGEVLVSKPSEKPEKVQLISTILSGATELFIAAGQMVWEAACVRKSFWVAPLGILHTEVLQRLIDQALFQLLEIRKLRNGQLWHLQVADGTAERITDQKKRAQAVASLLIVR